VLIVEANDDMILRPLSERFALEWLIYRNNGTAQHAMDRFSIRYWERSEELKLPIAD
jgi:hypothetical protein